MGQVGIGRFGKVTRTRFLERLATTCNVSVAARSAGVAVSSCYRLRARDAPFATAWDAALAVGYDRLEAALLEYALEKVERGAADPEAIAPEAIRGSVKAALAERTVSHSDLQLAVGILSRHRAAIEGKKPARGGQRMTSDETDAALRRALDGLSRRVKPA